MVDSNWQLQLFKKSIKKKDKVSLLQKSLTIEPDEKILDLGCAQGLLSFILKQKGGFWIHADLDRANLVSALPLLAENLIQIDDGRLPFSSASFTRVLCLDYLEHVEDDEHCLQEINRVLLPQGHLVLAVPQTGPFFMLHKLQAWLGLKLEDYGHKREGYTLTQLKDKLTRHGFKIDHYTSFSKFFSEFIELLLNFTYTKLLAPKSTARLRDGHIRPMSAEEFGQQKKSFRLYSMIYPILWGISRLDKLLVFTKGYSLIVWAKKVEDFVKRQE